MTIYTDRLELRPTNENDLDIFFTLITNPYVRKYLLDDEILNMDQVKDFLDISINQFNSSHYGLWLIESRETHHAMGFTGLWQFFDEGQPQLLYALLPQYTGYGFAIEAASAIVNYVFTELKFEQLIASCDEPNQSSQRLAEKLGMTRDKIADRKDKRLYYYRLNKEEFLKR
ncbi:GNAT family N-acetyltransferase [Pollutibacter soli]|uniref:GNAT family N-acetyltransferase n=1 Tax=Pollutibacter soli TaxID=3034157 RepID=UPI0030132403